MFQTPFIFFLGLAFPCKDGGTGSGNGGGSVVLGGKNVTRSVLLCVSSVLVLARQIAHDQVTSAPREVRVSIKTAVWMAAAVVSL